MLYAFEITVRNGKGIREPFSALLTNEKELNELVVIETRKRGHDVYFTTVKVKDTEDLKKWIELNK